MRKKIRRLSMFLALVMLLNMLIINVFAAPIFPFTDVKDNAWYYKDVKNAYEKKLINGKTQSLYGPDENMTYAQAVKLAACMHQLKKEGSVKLKNGNPWYQSYVDYAKKHKLITSDLAWNSNATRGGYMEIFANVLTDAESKKNNVPDGSIPDVGLAHQNATAIYKLYRAGIVTGVDAKHNCDPDASIKRSEVAAILTRMMDKSKRVAFSMSSSTSASSGGSGSGSGGGSSPAPTPTPTPTPSTPVNTLKIKTQPEDLETKEGDTVTMKVEATGGKEPYAYEWQIKADDPNKGFVNLKEYDFISGGFDEEDYHTLTINVTKSKSTDRDMTLRCVVRDSEGNSVTSDQANVTFHQFMIAEQPRDVTTQATEPVTFKVSVKGGKKPYTYNWLVNDGSRFKPIDEIADYSSIFDGVRTDTLTVKNFTNDWTIGRQYKCYIGDGNGSLLESRIVELNADGIVILEHPESFSGKAGQTANLKVKAVGGRGNTFYKWEERLNDGRWDSLDEDVLYSDVNTDTLKVHLVKNAFNGGVFRCVVTDMRGNEAISNFARVIIIP